MFAGEIAAAGFTLRRRPTHIGAACGTGAHAGAAFTLETKRTTGDIGKEADAEQCALAALADEFAADVAYDEATPTRNEAEGTVLRQVRQYRRQVAPTISPVAVEERLAADFAPDVVLSGQVDARTDGGLIDLKTGRQRRVNAAQYGAYSLLHRSHDIPVARLTEIYLPRVPREQVQPAATLHEYPVAEAERAASAIIGRAVEDLRTFRRTGDPWSFIANPHSVLCSPRFCSAHSCGANSFCNAWRKP
jgi:hypothetical protein